MNIGRSGASAPSGCQPPASAADASWGTRAVNGGSESVLLRAVRNRLVSDTVQFNPRFLRKSELRALQLAGLVHRSGWYLLSGAECWRFDKRAGKRLLASAIEALRAIDAEGGVVGDESATRKGTPK